MHLAVIRKMCLPALLSTHMLSAVHRREPGVPRGWEPGGRGRGGLGRIPGTGAFVCLLGQRKVFGGGRAEGDRGWWGGCFVSSMALNTAHKEILAVWS